MKLNTLRIVRPQVITPAMLVSTNVPENEYVEWNGGASYPLGQRVIVTSAHKVYQSSVAGNVGQSPLTSPLAWAEVGPTNRWKAFDQSNSTQTRAQNFLTYTIRPGQAIHSVAALNLTEATAMRVRVTDPGLGLIYDKTVNLSGQLLNSTWWDWFLGPRTEPKQCIYGDIPSAPAATITVDIAGTQGLAVGVILMGQTRAFSEGIRKGARIGITDYSRKERTEFGDTVLVERPFARRANWSPVLKASEVDAFVDFMAEIRAQPCLWIGSDRYEAMTVYGIYKAFDVLIAYDDISTCDLELEGLT
ncbi:hypothetical protein [Pseudorhodoferax sp. Leaf274]|uniref:hypothetical protein n=1 Tax=Pseudorhodoferax sp. Leaf274 TaxID=1736318 RepID=UPI00070294B2|nr:hypothetical protein [Pseudorhodoferax sp. Leaf274]KQP43906.1 carbohydrate-binding protein [Pseudorhodoferax sp. Leaf274]